jgi:alpha-ribazole phosphatase
MISKKLFPGNFFNTQLAAQSLTCSYIKSNISINMEIYLIRHTTPAVSKGICYGQTDLDVTETFVKEAKIISEALPQNIQHIYSSPLQRCSKLAYHLFPTQKIKFDANLMEINCGLWEMKKWDDIPKEHIDPWMEDFVNIRTPQGENYVDLFVRVTTVFQSIVNNNVATAIVAHGGVIRSILSHITATPLIDSFNQFNLHYGCVVKVEIVKGQINHTILSNIPHEKETHKPKRN